MEMNLIVNIAIVLVVIISLIWMWENGYRKQVREMLLILVIQAEKAWGRGTGAVKFSEVYNKLPTIVTLLFTRNDIEQMINDAVEQMKKYIESNSAVRSVI